MLLRIDRIENHVEAIENTDLSLLSYFSLLASPWTNRSRASSTGWPLSVLLPCRHVKEVDGVSRQDDLTSWLSSINRSVESSRWRNTLINDLLSRYHHWFWTVDRWTIPLTFSPSKLFDLFCIAFFLLVLSTFDMPSCLRNQNYRQTQMRKLELFRAIKSRQNTARIGKRLWPVIQLDDTRRQEKKKNIVRQRSEKTREREKGEGEKEGNSDRH